MGSTQRIKLGNVAMFSPESGIPAWRECQTQVLGPDREVEQSLKELPEIFFNKLQNGGERRGSSSKKSDNSNLWAKPSFF